MVRSKTNVQPTVAIIGGGINGLCCAWQLSLRGAQVTLFEKDLIMGEASSKSSKILHGGLQSLENRELRLVYEALRERHWWLQNCPKLCREVPLLLPVYGDSPRSEWLVNAELEAYQWLAGIKRLARHRWLNREELLRLDPNLNPDNLKGGFRYSEVIMDDLQLGMWVAQQARAAGTRLMENALVRRIDRNGQVELEHDTHRFDAVVNVTGPWAQQLLEQSGLQSRHQLALIRGSHLILKGEAAQHYSLQNDRGGSFIYVLPYQGNTLLGATEIQQTTGEPLQTSRQEISFLLEQYNRHYRQQRGLEDLITTTTALRPVIRSSAKSKKISGNYIIDRQQKLLTVFGGQWTSARALGAKVAGNILS